MSFRHDLGWAIRYAWRRPLLTAGVAGTLTASIAAATISFGLARAILWRPMPFADASRLVFVWEETERAGQRDASRVTGSRYAAWRDTQSGFSSLALFGAAGATVDHQGGATALHGVRVSANYFDVLGVRAHLGRTFVPGDEVTGGTRVVVLSHAFWRERFGSRADVVGEVLRLSGQPHIIVGVMPPMTFPAWPVNPAIVTLEPDSRQYWVPIARTPQLDQNAAHVFGVIGRLAPGVSEQEAIERLNRTSTASADAHQARLMPLREQFVADARTPLMALAGAALAVLLIACANLAALHVSAFESRRAELAMRAAIGASVSQLMRQLAIEAVLVACVSALAGMAIAHTALVALPQWLPPTIPFMTMPALDLQVAAFATGLALVASLILTAWPIVRLVIAPPSPRGVVAPPRPLVYRVLVVSQIAVTLALVAAASLLVQSLQAVRGRDSGFDLDRTLVASVALPTRANASPQDIAALESRVLAAVASRPGVRAVAAAYDHPLEANWSESPTLLGDSTRPEDRRQIELRIVSPEYFEALGVELVDGRTFDERDTLDAPGVAIVNEAYAREVGGPVLGRRLRSGTPRFNFPAAPDEFVIVGVAENERVRGLEQPAQPAFYLSTRQFPQTAWELLVRTDTDPLTTAGDIRTALRDVDAAISFSRPTSLEAILADQLVQRRVTTNVIGGLALGALAVAALGLYGLLAVLVGSHRREIGVRLAIGATPGSVARQVVQESLRNVLAGIALGGVLALATGRLLQSLLVDVSPRDPLTMVVVATVLFAVAMCAAVVPAVQAARVDPIEALRAD